MSSEYHKSFEFIQLIINNNIKYRTLSLAPEQELKGATLFRIED